MKPKEYLFKTELNRCNVNSVQKQMKSVMDNNKQLIIKNSVLRGNQEISNLLLIMIFILKLEDSPMLNNQIRKLEYKIKSMHRSEINIISWLKTIVSCRKCIRNKS